MSSTPFERLRDRRLLHLVDEAAQRHHVTRDDILGPRRLKTIAKARKDVYMALRGLGLSYPEIGWLVGRDHSTVLAGCRDVASSSLAGFRQESA